jgi:hypothetical protein
MAHIYMTSSAKYHHIVIMPALIDKSTEQITRQGFSYRFGLEGKDISKRYDYFKEIFKKFMEKS